MPSFSQVEIIEFFVEVTVLLIDDCDDELGVVIEYPLGNLLLDVPENAYTLDHVLIVSG